MINFFRHIRQQLLTENPPNGRAGKFSKYLLYALGEIVLVVIGILIALNINNRNEQRITKEKERYALEEIKSDLELNINSLTEMIDTKPFSVNNCLKSLDILIHNLEEVKIPHDSLARHFWVAFQYPDLLIKSSGYESLASIGMDLISDHQLRSEIGKFYTFVIPTARFAYTDVRDDFYHYMLDFMTSEFRSEPLANGDLGRFPKNYKELTNNQEFIESLKTYSEIFETYKKEAVSTHNECEKLHQDITGKLNSP